METISTSQSQIYCYSEERWQPGAISNDNLFVRVSTGGLPEHDQIRCRLLLYGSNSGLVSISVSSAALIENFSNFCIMNNRGQPRSLIGLTLLCSAAG